MKSPRSLGRIRPPPTASKFAHRVYRAGVRLLTAPARRSPEGNAKNALRCGVLSFQHSLATELALNSGDTAVQVGTPNPRTLMRFAKVLGPGGQLVIVEAMPENQDRLQATIDEHKLPQLSLIRAAACNGVGEGKLVVSPTYRGDHRILLDSVSIDNDFRAENAEMEVIPARFVRLDDALAEIGAPTVGYLSVTVNGEEVEVLPECRQVFAASGRGTRVYAKGHAYDDTGRPINQQVMGLLTELDYRVKLTRGEPSCGSRRAGDVYGWRP